MQLRVLEWIVAGCPAGVMIGTTHKTTAVALQNRRLATVSKKKGIWRAEPTAAGRHFAEHGEYPSGHWSDPASLVSAKEATFTKTSQVAATVPPPADSVSAPLRQSPGLKVTGLRPVDQMITDIVAAGGSLDVSDGNNYYDGLVASAVRFGKVPEGKLLHVVQRKGWGDKTLQLVDQPAWMTESLHPIPVADRLSKPHPAVVALRADKTRLPFKQAPRQRALRVLDALAKEATRRGYAVTSPRTEQHQSYQRRQQNQHGDLLITISGHPHALHVSEEPDKIPHEPTAKELRDFEARGYPRIPKYDKIPSGRLTININGGIPVRQSSFGDTKTIDLTTRLPTLLQELELRAANSEERRLQAEREAAERRSHWEGVRAQAAVAVRETHRAQVLNNQADTWHRAHQLVTYLDAMRDHVSTLDGDERTAADDWLTWANGYAHRINPLQRDLRMPPDPDVTHEALKPHMQGLSPYGPENRLGW